MSPRSSQVNTAWIFYFVSPEIDAGTETRHLFVLTIDIPQKATNHTYSEILFII